LILAVVIAPPIYFAVWALLYYCVKPIDSALKKWPIPFITMPCCALPLVMLGGLIVLVFLILPFGIVLEAFFKSKEEIGDSIAIEIHKKAIEESVNWINPNAVLINGFCMEPRRVMAFGPESKKRLKSFPSLNGT
jgi:hypothetical protein